MRRRVLDTQILIRHWRACTAGMEHDPSEDRAAAWAGDLIETYSTDVIVTPVYVEFVARMRRAAELQAARAYLARLRILDEGRIIDRDWIEAKRLAQRVGRDGKPRQLSECLVKAIANRFHCEVISSDERFTT